MDETPHKPAGDEDYCIAVGEADLHDPDEDEDAQSTRDVLAG